jgi:CDP-glucose 4,6-dehydratase
VKAEFWQGKRVFVTGHTGFKGGWLCLWLQRMGAEVVGYSLPAPEGPNLFTQADVAAGMDSRLGDLRDLDALSAAVTGAEAEIVFHLAAQSLVHRGYAEPLETYSTNVLGTAHLLEAVRRSPATRAVVSVTSDKCYENREWAWAYRENEALGGRDPYSSSKGCAELVTAAYRRSYFAPGDGRHPAAVASARSGNVIGGGDWADDRLLPDLVRAILGGRPALIRMPDAIRPWQHVLEPLRGYLDLAQRLFEDGDAFGSAWNFGPDLRDARPVRWIADRIVELWGGDAAWELDSVVRPPEAHYLKLDCAKAQAELGWLPALPLDAALEWLVGWYRGFARKQDLRALTLEQIAAYERRLAE